MTLKANFSRGLNEQLKDLLATHDKPADLHSLVALTINNRLLETKIDQCFFTTASAQSGYSSPPQLDLRRISQCNLDGPNLNHRNDSTGFELVSVYTAVHPVIL